LLLIGIGVGGGSTGTVGIEIGLGRGIRGIIDFPACATYCPADPLWGGMDGDWLSWRPFVGFIDVRRKVFECNLVPEDECVIPLDADARVGANLRLENA